jgi:hypothetical protein
LAKINKYSKETVLFAVLYHIFYPFIRIYQLCCGEELEEEAELKLLLLPAFSATLEPDLALPLAPKISEVRKKRCVCLEDIIFKKPLPPKHLKYRSLNTAFHTRSISFL